MSRVGLTISLDSAGIPSRTSLLCLVILRARILAGEDPRSGWYRSGGRATAQAMIRRMTPISPDHVRAAARLCRQTLEPVVNQDWTVRAGSLEWDCRQTTAHIADALGFYAAHLGSRATEWLKFDVVPHADATNLHLCFWSRPWVKYLCRYSRQPRMTQQRFTTAGCETRRRSLRWDVSRCWCIQAMWPTDSRSHSSRLGNFARR
jgi:hypothetical protein